MNNYNKILEAVNRGIQLALDDFDDDNIVQSIKSKQVYNRDFTKEYLDLMNEVVDLGLPSGTLWCKYNLDVNPNKLSNAKDWYGKYYAWGELKGNKTVEGKIYFDWSNYKYGNTYEKLIKYCNDHQYGLKNFMDNLTKLLPEDDAAYQNKKLHNYKFHIPTKEQCEELKNCTKQYWVNNYDPDKTIHNPKDDGGIQGLNGLIFEGKNENQLFIPAAGYYFTGNGSIGYIWSSSINPDHPCGAYRLFFDSDNINIGFNDRYLGLSIRPVIKL